MGHDTKNFDDSYAVIRERFYSSLTASPSMAIHYGDRAAPGPSIWTASRRWVHALRAAGIERGDRIVLGLEPSPGFVAALVACMWERLTIVLPGFGDHPESVAQATHARVVIRDADRAGCPIGALRPRRVETVPTPGALLLLRSSGTSGARERFVALSERNILSVIDSHRHALGGGEEAALSLLPWNHAFGLVLELLPALWSKTLLVRSPASVRDISGVLELATRFGARRANMVPLHAERVAGSDAGLAWLRSLRGGIVGGAPPCARMARILSTTKLRPGYGLTEASPGVTLGEPGEWHHATIGRPVGCEARIDPDGELIVTGPNVCYGYWEHERLVELDPGRALRTGDLVERLPSGSLAFLGRRDHRFKLGNGRMVDVPAIERGLQGVVVVREASGGRAVAVLDHSADEQGVRDRLGRIPARIERLSVPLPRTRKGETDRRAVERLINANTSGWSSHDTPQLSQSPESMPSDHDRGRTGPRLAA